MCALNELMIVVLVKNCEATESGVTPFSVQYQNLPPA